MPRENIFLDYYESRLLYSLLHGMNYERAMETTTEEKKRNLSDRLYDCYRKQEG